MNKQAMNNIRKSVCKNRGGWDNASDAQILNIWRLLPKEVQKQYLESIETQPKSKPKVQENMNHAVSVRPEKEVPGSPE